MIDWLHEVTKKKDLLVQDTRDFLKIESVFDPTTARRLQPFGQNIAKALEFMLELGKRFGLSTKNIDGYAGLIEYGDGEETVGVLVHVDVVPAHDGWTYPPFSATVKNGRIYARGALDNKGPALAVLYALQLVKERKLPLRRKIQLIIGTDEERDWRCVDYYFKKESMPTVGFVPDANFPLIVAEKGIANLELTWDVPKESRRLSLDRFYGGETINVVPDRATAVITGDESLLEKMRDDFLTRFESVTAEATGEALTLDCYGQAAHGSTPEKGKNASLQLASFLARYSFQRAAHRFLSFINDYLVDDVYGKKLNIQKSDEISGDLTVNAGIVRFDKEKAKIGLDIRYPVTVTLDEIIPTIKEVAARVGAAVTVSSHLKPLYVNGEDPLVQTLKNVYERQMGEKADLLATGGGTYARALKKGVAFGPLFPGRKDVAHQIDEYIEIDDLLKATAIYAEAMYELAK